MKKTTWQAAVRLPLTAGLIYWTWTGSRVALIIALALLFADIEIISYVARKWVDYYYVLKGFK